MTEVRYERNSAGIEELLVGEPMARVVNDYAHAGLTVFETIAVRRTSEYASSAEVITEIQAAPTPRWVSHLVATADYSAKVEFGDPGGKPRDGHHTLARVADVIGGVG